MRLVGVPAAFPEPVLDQCKEAVQAARPFCIYSDGDMVTGVFADRRDTDADVRRAVSEHMPELAA